MSKPSFTVTSNSVVEDRLLLTHLKNVSSSSVCNTSLISLIVPCI